MEAGEAVGGLVLEVGVGGFAEVEEAFGAGGGGRYAQGREGGEVGDGFEGGAHSVI